MRSAMGELGRSARRPQRPFRVYIGEQSGFTLVEMLVVMLLFGVVFSAAAGFYQIVVHRTDDTEARRDSLADVRGAMERVTREVREAKTATISNPTSSAGNTLTLITPTSQIIYDCSSADRCTREERTLDGITTDGPDELITEISTSTSVFTSVAPISAGATNVQVRLSRLPDGRSTPIVLTEDVSTRNECTTASSLLPVCS